MALATACPDGSPSMTPRFRLRNGRLPPPPGSVCSVGTTNGSILRDEIEGTSAGFGDPTSWKRRQSMIQLLGSTEIGVGAVGGLGARSPTIRRTVR